MDATGRRWGMRIAALGILCAAPGILLGQVTHGQKPQLPAPFATKSAGNPPEEAKPPKGFLPTVPAGFKINVFATDFKEPRWLTVGAERERHFPGRHARRENLYFALARGLEADRRKRKNF